MDLGSGEVNPPRINASVRSAVDGWFAETSADTDDGTFTRYRSFQNRKWVFIAVCMAVTALVSAFAITVGAYDLSIAEVYSIIWAHITSAVYDPDMDYIVVTLRSPRVVVAIVAGIGLAVAGVVMQSTLLNPLADPYTTGISSGASFGATLAMTLGLTVASGQYAIVINAFVFSLIPMMAILSIARIKRASPTTMIMAGIAIMYVFNACTTVMMLWADPNDMDAVYEWQVGSVSKNIWDEIPLMVAVTVAGTIVMQLLSRKLNVLSTGDESARSLGMNVDQMRTLNLLVVSMMTAAIVSFTGLIGFVGLVAPHIARLFVGPDNRFLIPASAALGAALLVCADLLGRVVIAPSVLPVGVIMSFIGGPMFLWLMLRGRSRMWS
ncbi:MAG: iron ABC transporter permease [Candidatus Methanomethylophilaceae archaeon]|nr:iron ABC transporter permease [Candidatus Methanomethylophilaceae archaeon]